MAFKRVFANSVDMYDTILELMTNHGWVNVSSLRTPPAGSVVVADGANSDWDVMRSVVGGLTYQMRPFRSTAETGTANHTIAIAEDIRNSDRKTMSIRMLKNYTPGAPGAKGVAHHPNVPWLSVNLFGTDNATPHTQTLAVTVTNIEILYQIHAEWAMFVFRFPPLLNRRCTFFYIGVPPSVRGDKRGDNDCILAQTHVTGQTGNRVWAIDFPVAFGDVAANTYLIQNTQLQLPLRNPSYLKEYWLAPVYYGAADIGMRGKLDGVFGLAANIGLVDRDKIMVGSKTYEVCELAVNSTFCSLNAGWMAVEIDVDEVDTEPEPEE